MPRLWKALLWSLAVVLCVELSSPVVIASPIPLLEAATPVASPDQDDATLHDVILQGESRGWAVGDRGVIWKTTDGGVTWEFVRAVPHLEAYSLRSVCFLTDRVGWVAGGTVLPVGGVQQGIVLFTRDGGATWSVQNSIGLPSLRTIQFFDLEKGLAVGERNSQFPSGVMQTEDGGQTWMPVNARESGRWTHGAFSSPQSGIVVGERGVQGILARGSLLEGERGLRGLKGLNAVTAQVEGRSWLVGGGALVLCSDNQGVSWKPPAIKMPAALEDFCDFHCIAQRGDHVWIAGKPGTVIWHSSDAGQNWTLQRTPDAGTVRALHFSGDQRGVAVGEFGRISLTRDGGENWTTVRGSERRLACLAIPTHAAQVPLAFLTRWGADEGYRTGVVVATRRDLGPDALGATDLESRVSQAVQNAGGNSAAIDWRLPLAVPGLDANERRLVEQWSQVTDRSLQQMVLGHLVGEIRSARPSVVLVTEAAEGDVAGEVMHRAIHLAVEQAADPSRFPEQIQLAGLSPWQVQKLVVQRREGVNGSVSLDSLELLPRLGTTLDHAAAEAGRPLGIGITAGGRTTFSVTALGGGASSSEQSIFGDLALSPGSAARRQLAELRQIDFDRLMTEVKQRRTVTAIGTRLTDNPAGGGAMLAQLQEIIRPLSPEQAARQLADLALVARQRGDWPLAEGFYAEMIARYPQEPVTIDAMLWLVKFWTSSEMNWQHQRAISARRSVTQLDGTGAMQANFEQALRSLDPEGASANQPAVSREIMLTSGSQTNSLAPATGDLQAMLSGGNNGGFSNQQSLQLQRRQELAMRVSRGLQEVAPHLKENAMLQFVQASLLRRRGDPRQADEIYARYLSTTGDDPWHIAAQGEVYLLHPGAITPKPEVQCKRVQIPPVLDGLLSDPCWNDALEVRLTAEPVKASPLGAGNQPEKKKALDGTQPIVMFAYDQQYLYVAASIPIDSRLPNDPPKLAGRQRDSELDQFDHLRLEFDVDRDYATSYRFEVDQRGSCREACWENWQYNPNWYSVVVRDLDCWRMEAAIPLEELLPAEQVQGSSWLVNVARIMPGIGYQSWSHAGALESQPALFGLLRFQ